MRQLQGRILWGFRFYGESKLFGGGAVADGDNVTAANAGRDIKSYGEATIIISCGRTDTQIIVVHGNRFSNFKAATPNGNGAADGAGGLAQASPGGDGELYFIHIICFVLCLDIVLIGFNLRHVEFNIEVAVIIRFDGSHGEVAEGDINLAPITKTGAAGIQ